jgi:hypothetical protein
MEMWGRMKNMEMIVSKNTDVEATINLSKFKTLLKKDLDLQNSFKSIVQIQKNTSDMSNDEAKHVMYMGTDWGQVMKFLHKNDAQIIKIGLNKVKINGFRQYKPDTALVNGQVSYTFEEGEIDDEEYMVIHNFVPMMEHHVDKFMNDLLFDYTQKSWEKKFV